MKIDRHNYEEFFLLYIDNELNVDERKQVDAFVLANPDLEEEFIMLKQSQLVADDSIVFENKESLMREEAAINMSNYEEWLLLYTDNELNPEEKLLVEKFTAAQPHVQEELYLFLQTKLEPEQIVFADKSSLYKREEKVRVISMTWFRVAVAAILILALGIGTYSIINSNKKISNDFAKGVNTPQIKSNQPGKKINNIAPAQDQTAEVKNGEVKNEESKSNQNETATIKQDQKNVAKKNDNIIPQQNLVSNNAVAINNTSDKTETTSSSSPETSPGNKTNVVTSLALNTDNNTLPQQTINNPAVTKTFSESPNYTEGGKINPEPGSDYASDGENKKLRGFFRKATRFIERTTKMNPANDDDKVLIGSVAVSLK